MIAFISHIVLAASAKLTLMIHFLMIRFTDLNNMSLKYDGIEYRTVGNVTDEFKTSNKHLKKLITTGKLPAPETITRGGRTFRHFDDAWMKKARKHFKSLQKKTSEAKQ